MNRILPLLLLCLAHCVQGRLAAQVTPATDSPPALDRAQASTSDTATNTPAATPKSISTPTSPQESQPLPLAQTTSAIDQKLKNTFVSLDFSPGTTIEEATTFLSNESKRLDPDHKGVNFIIQPDASASAKPISLTLNNVPLREALRYICLLADVKYKVRDYAISIIPISQSSDDLISRTFIVQPDFVAPPSAITTDSAADAAFGGGGRPLPQTASPGVTPGTRADK